MGMIAKIIIGAIVIEAIIEYFNATLSKKFHPRYILSIIFGSVFAIIYGLDLLAILGLETNVPYAGMIFTGILLSRGSNYITHFIKRVTSEPSNMFKDSPLLTEIELINPNNNYEVYPISKKDAYKHESSWAVDEASIISSRWI